MSAVRTHLLVLAGLLLTALLLPLAACKVEVPKKLASALAEKTSGKKTERPVARRHISRASRSFRTTKQKGSDCESK